MTLRIVHPAQQGSRLPWSDSLFEQVEHVQPVPVEALPVPEVTELQWPQLVYLVETPPAGGSRT